MSSLHVYMHVCESVSVSVRADCHSDYVGSLIVSNIYTPKLYALSILENYKSTKGTIHIKGMGNL